MQTGWYGYGQHRNAAFDTSPPASPLYDSGDDEPTEPSSIVNALAVTVPPLGSRQHQSVTSSSSSMRRTRSAGLSVPSEPNTLLQAAAVPHPHQVLARPASATAALAAASAAAASTAASSSSSSSSSAALRRTSSGSSNSSSGSGSGSGGGRHARSSKSSRRAVEEVLQHTSVLPGSRAVRFPAAHRTAGGTIVLPLSSAALTAADAKGARLAQQDLSLVTNRASNVDADLRPLHHLHMMQQRRHNHHHSAHQQHHKQRQQQQQHVAACAHVQVHSGGCYLAPMGRLAEIAAS
uniref:Uncharacterized protein n=1 Tax=Tetradesmus obliquus TaxID=3088 RepID=A0A383V5Q3_TETOB|eukprot:jgi/Sobl393_1/10053/SZX59696.1